MAELTPRPDKYKAAGIGVVPPELGVVDTLNKPIAPLLNSATLTTDSSGNINISTGSGYAFRPVMSRLKAAMAAALISNPVTAQPLVQPPAWVSATAYTAGQAVSNAGNNYIALSPITAATAPTATTNAPIADGGGYWYYVGPTFTSAAGAPTLSVVAFASRYTGTFFSGTQNNYAIGSTQVRDTTNFVITGASTVTETGANNAIAMPVNQAGASGLLRVQFMTDAAAFQIVIAQTGPGPGIVAYADGVPITLGTLGTNLGTSSTYYQVVFPQAKDRLMTVELPVTLAQYGFYGVLMNDTTSKVWAPLNPNKVRAYGVGTSYFSGSSWHPVHASFGIFPQMMNLLGVTDFAFDNSGAGCGYVATGSYGVYATPAKLTAIQAYAPDVIVVFGGGINDASVGGITLATEQAAVTNYLTQLRAIAPTAPIFVIGSEAGATGPSANVFMCELAAQQAVAAMGDPGILFIPQSYTTPAKAWISTTVVNNAANYISTDNVHPWQAGVNLLAYRGASGIRAAVQPLA